MQRRLPYIGVLCCLPLLVQPQLVQAGSAVTVPVAARDTAAQAKADAQDVLDKEEEKRYRENAALEAKRAAEEAATAARQAEQTEEKLKANRVQAEQAEKASQEAAASAQQAAQQAAAQQAAADAANAEAEAAAGQAEAIEAELTEQDAAREEVIAQHEAAADAADTSLPAASTASYDSSDDSDELLARENEYRRLEAAYEAEQQVRQRAAVADNWSAPAGADWSQASSAYAYANELAENAAAITSEADAANEAADQAADAAERAAEAAADAKQAVADGELEWKDAQTYEQQAGVYAVQAKTELEKLIYAQEHPKPVWNLSTGMNVYQWRDSDGNHGHQVVLPFSVGYWQKDLSWYLNTNWVNSNHGSTPGGSVNTLTDTTVSVAKRNEKKKFIVDYLLEVNIPTGKPALSWSERYAKMNEDLVEKSTFGEGWKFAPGIDVSWRIGKEDLWTVGTSYSFNGSYDPTTDVPGDTVSPGNGWNGHLRWEHAGQKWQMIAELLYSRSNSSHLSNGSNYTTPSTWEYRLTYNRPLSKTSDLMFYYWHENRNIDAVVSDTSQARVHYLGSMLSRKIGKAHTIRYTFDYMRGNGLCYSGVRNYFDEEGLPQYSSIDVDGRTKYTLGVGYDIQLRSNANISFDLEAFRMHDGISTEGRAATSYNGMNFLVRYNQTF